MTQKPLTASNSPSQYSGGITLKSKEELNLMHEAGIIVGTVLGNLKLYAEVGMTTQELDDIAEKKIRLMGGLPVFKGYMGFPSTICASINEEIVHGIPDNRIIKNGDILTVDCGASVGGYIGDAAITFQIGKSTKISQNLIKITNESLNIGINPKDFEKYDIHVHVPEGATPKDGPSAGVAIFNSLVSSLTSIKIKKEVAMTGEITLRGRILPIGGLKEKLYAAVRAGIKTVLIPEDNIKDLNEINKKILKSLNIIPVSEAKSILDYSLTKPVSSIDFSESNEIKERKSNI